MYTRNKKEARIPQGSSLRDTGFSDGKEKTRMVHFRGDREKRIRLSPEPGSAGSARHSETTVRINNRIQMTE